MRKPAITFDALFAAIAVLGASAGCSKAERAAAEPPAAAPAASAASPADNAPAPPPPPALEATPAATASAAVVDAGVERTKPSAPAKKAGGSAACGATGCSAEMRKGGK